MSKRPQASVSFDPEQLDLIDAAVGRRKRSAFIRRACWVALNQPHRAGQISLGRPTRTTELRKGCHLELNDPLYRAVGVIALKWPEPPVEGQVWSQSRIIDRVVQTANIEEGLAVFRNLPVVFRDLPITRRHFTLSPHTLPFLGKDNRGLYAMAALVWFMRHWGREHFPHSEFEPVFQSQ